MFGQQRSQSGPSGLSINTGAANSLGASATQAPQFGGQFGSAKPSLFGTTSSTAPSAGTLFGTSTTATTQASSLFGSTAAAGASKAGTLFGGSAINQANAVQPAQPTQGGLFGAVPTTQTQGGLFGQTVTAQPQQQTTSLFGSSTAMPPQQNQGSSLFGALPTQNAQPQQQTTSLFGSLNQPAQQVPNAQAQQASSLFGSLNQSTQQAPQASIFGANNASKSLFGATQPTQNTQKSIFPQPQNSTLLPQQQTQRSLYASIGQYSRAQETVPGVRIDASNIRPTTRFNDLHEDLQRDIEQLDLYILQQINYQVECEQAMPSIAAAFTYIPSDVEFCTLKLDALQRALETDAAAIEAARSTTKTDASNARISFKAIHNLRMPSQFHTAGLFNNNPTASTSNPAPGLETSGNTTAQSESSSDLIGYFTKQTQEMDKKMEGFKKNLTDVETYLSGLESNTNAQIEAARWSRGHEVNGGSTDDKIRELAGVLREFEAGIIGVAGKVGKAREGVLEVMLNEGNGRRR